MTDTPELSVDRLLAERGWLADLARSLVRDPASADDLAQRSWLAALRADRHPLDPRAWLATIVRNEARQTHRSETRRRARERAVAAHAEIAAPSAAEAAERFDTRREVVAAVDGLDEPFRATVLLHHFEGVPLAEIARRMEIPAGTARWRLFRAHELLRTELERRLGGERWRGALVAACIPAGARFGAALSGSAAAAIAVAVLLLAALGIWSALSEPAPLPGERTAVVGDAEDGERASVPAEGTSAARDPVERGAPDGAAADAAVIAASTSNETPVRDEFAILRARLVDTAGTPLRGRLRLDQVHHGMLLLRDDRLAWLLPPAASDADGRATLPLRTPRALLEQIPASFRPGQSGVWTLEVVAEADGHAAERRLLRVRDGDDLDLGTLTLPPAVTIQGRVLDADGRGLNGARVSLEYGPFGAFLGVAMARAAAPAPPEPVTTSGFFTRGAFRFDGVRSGLVRVTVEADGHGEWSRTFDSASLDDDALTIRLERDAAAAIDAKPEPLAIRVVDAAGVPQPAMQVRVWVSGYSRMGWSDANGRFEVRRTVGSAERLRAFASDRVDGATFRSGWLEDADPAAGELRIVLATLPRTALTVTDPDGRPLAGATAHWTLEVGPDADLEEGVRFRTDADGTVSLPASGRTARLVVAKDGYARAVGEAIAGDAVPSELRVTLAPVQGVRGRVVDAEGRPVAAAAVLKLEPDDHVSAQDLRAEWFGTGRFDVETDADGRFALFPSAREPIGARLRLLVRHADHAPAVSEELRFDPARGVEDVTITLEAGGALRGTLRTTAGDPLPNRWVALNDGVTPVVHTLTDARGRYAFERLRPARYEVALPPPQTHWDHHGRSSLDEDAAAAPHRTDVEVPRGGPVEHDIVADACRLVVRIEGEGLDDLRAGVAALCRAHDRHGVTAGTAGPDGSFVLTSHATGPHHLRIVNAGRDGGAIMATAEIDLLPGDRELVLRGRAGRVTLPAPPIDGYRILQIRATRGDFDLTSVVGIRPGATEAHFPIAPLGAVAVELRATNGAIEALGARELR